MTDIAKTVAAAQPGAQPGALSGAASRAPAPAGRPGEDAGATRVEAHRRAAVAFEATFLAEMLKHAGLGRATPGFDGGAGEAAFGGELVAAQAELLARRGGIGVADRLFETMLAREEAGDER
jgi:hypothetical protein